MKRAVTIFVVGLLASVAVVVGLSIKRVPTDVELIRVAPGGEVSALSPGWHFIPFKRGDVYNYPLGRQVARFPAAGEHPFISLTGERVDVAVEVELQVSAGAGELLYNGFSRQFDDALGRLIQAHIDAEGSRYTPNGERDRFANLVATAVRNELGKYKIALQGFRLLSWNGVEVRPAPGAELATAAPIRKVLLVGIDGGDWLNLMPLIERGTLPNFRRVVREGAIGPLRSLEPMLSPLLWTTMATGKYPEDHGILNFTVDDPQTGQKVPITRLYRKVDAFWNMLSDVDRRVAMIGWLATYPAEPVNGLMVTDRVGYVAYAPLSDRSVPRGAIYPEDKVDETIDRVMRGANVSFDQMEAMLHISPEAFAAHRDSQDPRDSVHELIQLYASTLSYRNMAVHQLTSERPDVVAVYFEWVDAISHLFMLHTPPRMDDVSSREFDKYRDVVEQGYILQDQVLGDLMNTLGDEYVMMIVSDHGFKSGESRLRNRPEIWAGNAAKWHRLDGIVAFWGNGVKVGQRLEGATLLDVAPTVLALSGMPQAQDMPGKALVDAFTEPVKSAIVSERVPTLQRQRVEESVAIDPEANQALMDKITKLGYVNPKSSGNADMQNNLGQRYQQRGEYQKAIDAYQEALRLRPNFKSVYNNLAVCYGELKMFEQAESSLAKVIELEPNDFYAMNNLAVLYIETQRMSAAQKIAERAVAIEPGYVNGRVTLGSVYAMTGQLDKAREQFTEALRLDPDNRSARSNLAKVEAQMGGQR